MNILFAIHDNLHIRTYYMNTRRKEKIRTEYSLFRIENIDSNLFLVERIIWSQHHKLYIYKIP